MSTTEIPYASDPVTTAEEWENSLHDPVLPSGRKVLFRDTTLAELLAMNELPTDLRQLAIDEYATPGSMKKAALAPYEGLPEKPSKTQQKKADEASNAVLEKISLVNRHLIALALVQPKMSVEQLAKVPYADLQYLSLLINRQIGTDAVGRYVGVVPLDQFHFVVQAHGVEHDPADCETCASLRWTLSTVRRS